MRRPLSGLCTAFVLVLVLAACGGDEEDDASPTTEPPSSTTTDAPDGTEPSEDTDAWQPCESSAGFSLSYPADWETNAGDVVGPCSQFDPEPFEVPEATDERVAVINAYVDPVGFADAAAPGSDRMETERATTVVDGRQTVRLEGPASELFGEGTTAVRYLVDVPSGDDGQPRTLVVDAVERAGGDFDRAVEVLDRMVRSIDIGGADGIVDGQTVVARYGGGGTPFAAGVEPRDGEHCLTVPLEGDSVEECFSVGGPDDVRVADLSGDLLPVLGGITGADVFRVDVERADGTTFSTLPVPVEDGGARGFAVPVDPDEVTGLSWSSMDGTQLGSRDLDAESDVEPVVGLESPSVAGASYPAAGSAAAW
ncbi:hypothetical protein [Rhabdothermincola salaria]|uniref:hypothetical protein n=1 Tax=Rhabdothermincola salaria TaxID=2903142 RepID=UPI001E4072BC|nr:hypothetical protein [Rhabdothermincola salaria]MCD9625645.1 hypothetical protein [Rhabdothermincola salaria]